jgi:hypothetical protein
MCSVCTWLVMQPMSRQYWKSSHVCCSIPAWTRTATYGLVAMAWTVRQSVDTVVVAVTVHHVSGIYLWTATTNGPIVNHPDDIWVWRAMVEWYWQGKPKQKPVLVSLCQSWIPHELTWVWSYASTVRGQRLIAWAVAWPLTLLDKTLGDQGVGLSCPIKILGSYMNNFMWPLNLKCFSPCTKLFCCCDCSGTLNVAICNGSFILKHTVLWRTVLITASNYYTYLVMNSMERRSWGSQEITYLFWNPKVCYCVHKSPQLVYILS